MMSPSLRRMAQIGLPLLLMVTLLPLWMVHHMFASEMPIPSHLLIRNHPAQNTLSMPLDKQRAIHDVDPLKDDNERKDGCQVKSTSSKRHTIPKVRLPTGIVITLIVPPTDPLVRYDSFRQICTNIPNQIRYFIEPQGLDLLLVVAEEKNNGWTNEKFSDCIGLSSDSPSSPSTKRWTNLDGTSMQTTQFHFRNGTHTKVHMASTSLSYPPYIEQNKTLLKDPIEPKSCSAPPQYIQSTRWYTQELLHLGILEQYDYFLKIDTDIIFRDSIPFHILQDMETKGAVFAHSAEYFPSGSKTCARGIVQATEDFLRSAAEHGDPSKQSATSWKGAVCSTDKELHQDTDLFYTNFIVGKREYFQSKLVLRFSNFLSNYRHGFFKYRWTDQIFWHRAMGLFLTNYRDFIVDYTDLRCMPNRRCWPSSFNFATYGQNAWHNCDNLGYFVHPKDYDIQPSFFSPIPAPLLAGTSTWSTTQQTFESTYEHNCKVKQ